MNFMVIWSEVPTQNPHSNILFRKETVLEILSSDGEKPKIEILGMQNGYLDIGFCAGVCRHSNSVSTITLTCERVVRPCK